MHQNSAFIKRLSAIIAIIAALIILGSMTSLFACGWGSQGGADYVPQERNLQQQQQVVAQGQPITSDQAKKIVTQYIKPVNPQVRVGTPNNAGPYYKVDLIGTNGETVEIVGVDKYSGRIQVLK